MRWALSIALVVLFADSLHAGDREMEILVVNMTPDPVSDAGRQCSQTIRRAIRRDYTRMRTMGETALREKVGGAEDFMTWTAAQLEPIRTEGTDTRYDAIALFDCRPDAQRADVLVLAPIGGNARMRLRGVSIDGARAQWLAEAILRHGWIGFSP